MTRIVKIIDKSRI